MSPWGTLWSSVAKPSVGWTALKMIGESREGHVARLPCPRHSGQRAASSSRAEERIQEDRVVDLGKK